MDRLYQLQITTPAGTTPDQPQVTPFPVEDSVLDSLTVVIPDGHAGLTGIRVLQAQQEIVPWSNDDWLVSNNEIVTVPVNTQIGATSLSVETYNTDVFAHSHWVRLQISPLGSVLQVAAPTPAPIASTVLSDIGL